METEHNIKYAGFWIRVVAYFIDSLIISAFGFVLTLVLGLFAGVFAALGQKIQFDPQTVPNYTFIWTTVFSVYFGSLVLLWLYFALQYSSRNQGTFGMRAVGIKVVDYDYQRISFSQATGRHFAHYLSAFILYIGFFMIAFTERKQGLHDFMARTYVVYSSD